MLNDEWHKILVEPKNSWPKVQQTLWTYKSPNNSKGTAVVDESESFRNSTWKINMKDNHRGLQWSFSFLNGEICMFHVNLPGCTWLEQKACPIQKHTHLLFQADNLKQHRTHKIQMLCQPPRPKKETWPSWISLDHPTKIVLKKTTGSFKITLSALDI